MISTISRLPVNPDPSWLCRENPCSNTLQSTTFTREQHQDLNITLFTDEGDKVTLSSASLSRTEYTSVYNRMGYANGSMSAFRGTQWTGLSSHNFSLSLEGDLSQEEMKDIAKAVRSAEKILRNLLLGNTGQAMHEAMKTSRLDTLSSLQADLHVEQVVTFEKQVLTTAPADPEPAAVPLPPEENGDPPLMQDPTATAIPAPANGDGKTMGPTRPVNRLIARLLERLGAEEPDNWLSLLSPDERIQADLLKDVVSHPRKPQTEVATPDPPETTLESGENQPAAPSI
ncbi:MAG: hypothetical protein JXL84_12415 [Deltaproteobacteria bacterium]|nr:hypothetical protein [Deltaproteobacteria bacterium]